MPAPDPAPAADPRPRLRTRLAVLYAAAGIALGLGVLAVVESGFWRSRLTRQVGAAGPAVASSNTATLLLIGVAGIFVVAAAAVPLGWWLAGRAVRPLEQLAAAARTAAPGRLPGGGEPGRYREFADLSATLTALYARLDTAYAAQRRFVADASHELRTPLAAERALLQVALADPDADADTLRAACTEVLDLNTQQERLIAALLALAQGDQRPSATEPVDLAALAGGAIAARTPGGSAHGLHLAADLQPALVSRGDPALLASLLGNLLDNAIRYNIDGGRVDVTTRSTGAHAVLVVANTGPIVPAEAVERILRPFQRLAAGRTDASGGSGLGLAIVRAIADSHGATLHVRPQPAGGLHVEVIF